MTFLFDMVIFNINELTTWATMLYNKELTGMGYIRIPWWGGNYYPDLVFGQEVMDWASAFAKRIPEFTTAFANLLKAENEDALEQAAWAAEDLFFQLGYKIPACAILYMHPTLMGQKSTRGRWSWVSLSTPTWLYQVQRIEKESIIDTPLVDMMIAEARPRLSFYNSSRFICLYR